MQKIRGSYRCSIDRSQLLNAQPVGKSAFTPLPVLAPSMLVVATTGVTTIFAQQNYNLFNAQLAELYPHNVFNAKLARSNEVPPVTTAASGIATFQLLPAPGHEQVFSFQLSLKNITGVMGAHIHNGKQGENGPVVADLFNPTNPTGAINGKLAAGTLTSSKLTGSLHNKELSALVNMIRSGEAYVRQRSHNPKSKW